MKDVVTKVIASPTVVVVSVAPLTKPVTVVMSSAPVSQPGPRGLMGPRGQQGVAGSDALTKYTLSALSANKVVRLSDATHVTPISALERSDAWGAIAVTVTAASAPETAVSVIVFGELADDSWNWVPGLPIFVGANGGLTQTRDPAWAFVRVIGNAISPARIFIDSQPAVLQV